MKIAMANDHAGTAMKNELKKYLLERQKPTGLPVGFSENFYL